MKAVPIHLFGDIDRIVHRTLTEYYAVAEHDAIAQYDGVLGVDSGTSRTSRAPATMNSLGSLGAPFFLLHQNRERNFDVVIRKMIYKSNNTIAHQKYIVQCL